jgi:hypothetical protein
MAKTGGIQRLFCVVALFLGSGGNQFGDNRWIFTAIAYRPATANDYCQNCFLDLLGSLWLALEVAMVVCIVGHEFWCFVLGRLASNAHLIFDVEGAAGI